jgi:hypothetical protein
MVGKRRGLCSNILAMLNSANVDTEVSVSHLLGNEGPVNRDLHHSLISRPVPVPVPSVRRSSSYA